MSEAFDSAPRVRYAEMDRMGIIYCVNRHIYFEIGRVEFMRDRRLSTAIS